MLRIKIFSFILIVSILLFPTKQTYAQQFSYKRNWLRKSASRAQIASYLATIDHWRESKKKSLLNKINSLPNNVKQKLVQNGEKYLSFKWPNLPATVFLQFSENGNRTNYQDLYFKRRKALEALVIAELVERKGRFIPQIINGIWAICEQTTWGVPANTLPLQKIYTPLPYPGENVIDLDVGSMAAVMSWTYFLLQDELDSVTMVIPKRIKYEIKHRVFKPYLKRNDFWWMGFQGQKVNNWNPWINGNVLLTTLLTGSNQAVMDSIVYKTMRSVDFFINQYKPQGFRDEGPSYWNVSAGSLIKYLQLLKNATNGDIDISNRPLIKKMGEYIYKMNICGDEFVDYGDSHPRLIPNIAATFDFGKVTHNKISKQFAAYFAKSGGSTSHEFIRLKDNLPAFINYLSIYREIKKTHPEEPLLKLSWQSGLQILTVRSHKGSCKGLFLSAKGGSNGVSHNHNDAGNFVIYVNSKPAIIDIGVGTYTRQTFSKSRYKIFTMQSAWHNLPTINGVMQHAGEKFRAKDIQFSHRGKIVHLSMNIAGAYPKKASVKSWIRSLTFDGEKVTLKEKYELKTYKKPFTLSLITPLSVQIKGDNIILKDSLQRRILKINFNHRKLMPKVQTKVLKDPELQHEWGNKLNRIILTDKTHRLSGKYQLIFTE